MDRKQFVRRSADWLEKISVASLAVGIFQGAEKMVAAGCWAPCHHWKPYP